GTYILVAIDNGNPAITLLGKVSDAKKLTASAGADHLKLGAGWAAIGSQPMLDRLAPYALAALTPLPVPKSPTATVYVPQVLAKFQPQLSAVRAQMMTALVKSRSSAMGSLMTTYIDGLASVGQDTERMIVTLDAAQDSAALDLAFLPRAKSRLATFTAAQRPSDYALLGKLPASTPSMLVGGRVDLGPYHDGFLAMMAAVLDPSSSKDLLAAMEQLRKAMTGEIAMALQFAPDTGMQMVQLFGTADAKSADQGISRMFDLFKAGRTVTIENMSTTTKANPTPIPYDGVALRSYDTTYDLSKATPEQRKATTMLSPSGAQHAMIATFDAVTLVMVSPDVLNDAKKAVDAARGKASGLAQTPAIRDLLAASRARKDSLAAILDLGRFVAAFAPGMNLGNQPMVMSFGAADHNAHIRIALPAATLRAAANMKP
ncbi:MAG TPA: hypothetical protein VH165_08610, partial [Kofleriaceae bacterium]|nr:hypothetical protein [Kofleriaceae bacterium]